MSDMNTIYSLLHESGHIIIGSKRSYVKEYKSIIKGNVDGRHTRSNIYKYKKFKEEIDAWDLGYKLSKKLKLNIDRDKYENYAAKCVNTYLKYL